MWFYSIQTSIRGKSDSYETEIVTIRDIAQVIFWSNQVLAGDITGQIALQNVHLLVYLENNGAKARYYIAKTNEIL